MPWFYNEESGQTFEAVGNWEKEARSRGCEEIDDPTAPKSKTEKSDAKEKKTPASEPEAKKVTTKDPETKKPDPETKKPDPEKKPDEKGGEERK